MSEDFTDSVNFRNLRCSDLDRMSTIELLNSTADYLDEDFKTQTYWGVLLRDRAKRIQDGLNYYSTSTKEVDKPYQKVLETVNMSINQFKGELVKIEDELGTGLNGKTNV